MNTSNVTNIEGRVICLTLPTTKKVTNLTRRLNNYCLSRKTTAIPFENDGFGVPVISFRFHKNLSVADARFFSRNRVYDYEYLIVTSEECDSHTLQHELAHARYHLDGKYKKHVLSVLHRVHWDFLSKLMCQLVLAGYPASTDTLMDEIQAYLLTSPLDKLDSIFPGVDKKKLYLLKDKLN